MTLVDRAGVGAAAWVATGTALAVPLVAMNLWRPVIALPALLVALAVAVRVSGLAPGAPGPRWAAIALVVVAVGSGAWAGATRAEHVVLRRDAGTYALSAQHLATQHGLRVDVDVPALGGPAVLDLPGATVGSPGMFQQGSGTATHVVPQFLPATTVMLALGWWAAGWTGLLLAPAVALAFALLAFGALARRLIGPRWAVAATTALALTQPVLHAGRSTYSEPFALLVGCAAMAVLVAAHETSTDAGSRRLALVAGLLLGSVALVRVDGLREAALAVPVVALLASRRSGLARQLGIGLAIATAYAGASALLVSRPYLGAILGSLLPLLGAGVVLGGGSVLALRVRQWPGWLATRAPWLLSAATLLGFVALASRPLWLVARQDPDDPGARVVAQLQAAQGLAVDGARTYAEASVGWTAWWVGAPALVLALAAAGWLAHRLGVVLRDGRPLPGWLAPALIGVASTALTFYRPGITPDHPWADRRLVPVVLPTVLLLATAALARLRPPGAPSPQGVVERARRPHLVAKVRNGGVAGGVAMGVAGPVLGIAMLLAPAALATWPVATQRTERGEIAAVRRACAAFGPLDTAVLVDSRAGNEWTQVLRGVCGVPSLVIREPDLATVTAVARAIQRAGRRPVLVSAGSAQALVTLGASPRQVVALRTSEDQHLLTRRPDGAAPLAVDLWLGPVSSGAP